MALKSREVADMSRVLRFFAMASLGIASMTATASVTAQTPGGPRITRASELPPLSIPVRGNMEAFVRAPDSAPARALSLMVRRHLDSVLRTYDIADPNLTRSLKGTLLQIAMLEERDDDALRLVDERRALSVKVGARLMTGLESRAMIAARRRHADLRSPEYARELGRVLLASLQALPFDSVQNELREAKAGLTFFSEPIIIGPVRRELQPIVDSLGAISLSAAREVIGAMFSLRYEIPVKPVLFAAYDTVLAGRTNAAKVDIWSAREANLAGVANLSPVTIGIWDSGLDTLLFSSQLKRDARGQPVVMGFDQFIRPANSPMATLPAELLARQDDMNRIFKGLGDLDANLETAEAKLTRDRMATLSPDSVSVYEDWIAQWNGYTHGTAVTSVAIAQNPAARIVIGRMQFSHAAVPDPCPSRANAEREAAMLAKMVEFFRANAVRVVNMSWGRPESGFLGELERCAARLTQSERVAIARYAIDTLRRAMTGAMRASPQILFVAAAGNSGNNTEFNDFALRIDLPNMLLVGAVDRAGDEASFTNTGPLIRLYANGYLVSTRVPGGGTEASSGTSFAAPGVVNTAAKMLAVQPSLRTDELLDILLRTAEVRGSRGLRVMHPANAVAAARAARSP